MKYKIKTINNQTNHHNPKTIKATIKKIAKMNHPKKNGNDGSQDLGNKGDNGNNKPTDNKSAKENQD